MNDQDILDELDRELGPAATRHHVLRRHGNILLDTPITSLDGSRVWAATLTIDHTGHWRRSQWRQHARGLEPVIVHYGDVIEFGTGTGPSAAWYGYLTDTTPDAVIITGPDPTAVDAYRCGQDALRRWQGTRLASHGERTLRIESPTPKPSESRDDPVEGSSGILGA